MPVMTKADLPMDMSQYVGDDFIFVGGFRSGSSPSGMTRLKYDIYHKETFKTEGEDEAKAGMVEVFVDDFTGEIKGLVNIKLDKKFRGGTGRLIVNDLVDTAGGELVIYDIKPESRGF